MTSYQCPLSRTGPDATPFSAFGFGTTVGSGTSGPLPVALSFGATTPAGAAPGTTLGAHWVQKDGVTHVLSTSNVVEIFVP